MTRCLTAVFAGLLLIVTSVIATVSFIFVEWGKYLGNGRFGLWETCWHAVIENVEKCGFFYKLDGEGVKISDYLPAWFIASDVLFTLAMLFLVFALIFMPFYCCFAASGGARFDCLGHTVFVCSVMAGSLMAVGLLLFGLEATVSDHRSLAGRRIEELGWAFWLMVATCVLTFGISFVVHFSRKGPGVV